MRYKKEIKRVAFDYATDYGLERTYVRQPSLVDSFYWQQNKCPETGEVTHQFSHPLYMLFNQERLDRLGEGAIAQWIKSLDSVSSSKNEIKSKICDEDLLSMVKSRHIQHPCEVEAYIRDLNQRADFFNSEVARVLAEQRAEQEQHEQKDSVDTQPNTK